MFGLGSVLICTHHTKTRNHLEGCRSFRAFVGPFRRFLTIYCTGMDIQHRLDAVAALTLGT